MTASTLSATTTTMISPILLVVMSIMPKSKSNQDITVLYSGHLHNPLNRTCGCECAVDESGGGYGCGSDCYMCD